MLLYIFYFLLSELEGSPFGAYCPADEHCEYRYTNQTSGLLLTGKASGSNSNLYYSINVGLVHFVVLDSMYYIGLETSATEQLAWLKTDLAQASAPTQREKVPWIIVLTHVPFYCQADGNNDQMIQDIEPLLMQSGVDAVFVGHAHIYESQWPVGPNGKVPKESFVNPQAPVHVVSGVGAAPAFGAEGPTNPEAIAKSTEQAFNRKSIFSWSYSVLDAINSSHLKFCQIDNMNGTIIDEFTIIQSSHGPFI